eukprot:CAMPEP_0172519956 /NCGR_PEP_ID=MMETSP1066-20121228/291721_1 /TAXON_ID=671091 /ORGANISM="Coscinodiscus wailesii, Strain CCMP2513" /LENGTH=340 /DNA_ID=CAMNT_0013302631 /DNA_START=89 /DNA_END=1111 /DNA_ORIENTATION=-
MTPAIPPLSNTDTAKIAILLPLLSALKMEPINNEAVNLLLPFLCEYAIDSDNNATSREAAALCFHNMLSYANPEELHSLYSENLYTELRDKMERRLDDQLRDVMTLVAMLGSVTSARGGPCTATSSKIINLLLHLSSNQSLTPPLPPPTSNTPLLAAETFGLIVSSAPKSNLPFWKQRTSFMALNHLKKNDRTVAGDIILLHVGCNLPYNALGEENLAFILKRVLCGLQQLHEDFITMALSFLLKSIAVLPKQALVQCLSADDVFSIILQILTRKDNASAIAAVPQLLLVLQILKLSVSYWNVTDYKLEVLGKLGPAVDHPTRLVRNAAVDVTNFLSVLD